MPKLTPTVLLILDGWGSAPEGPGNAFVLANTPNLDAILATPSHSSISCSGRAVGLPAGYMGNSEVGHMNLGAGRIVYQEMTRIDLAIENKTFMSNKTLLEMFGILEKNKKTLHLMGLLSDGGVHSHINHLFALISLASSKNIPVAVHAFMDGRDTSPTSGESYIESLLAHIAACQKNSKVEIVLASVTGRYYAMDRDQRWERVEIAWNSIVNGQGEITSDPVKALEDAYATGETDEFIKPRLVADKNGGTHTIKDGDAVFFFNFRADRARQLLHCFYNKEFKEFPREVHPNLSYLASMTAYESTMPVPTAFAAESLDFPLGKIVSDLGLKQLRIAETEKYAHVTYFFNCGQEEPFSGEERILIPSPRDVATYDLKPEMSALKVTEALVAELDKGVYSFVVCNLANTDMVGHSGIIPAAIKACEAVDECVGKIWQAVKRDGGRLIVTADHGNVEEMLTPEGKPQTAHSTNPVPLVVLDEACSWKLKSEGKLGDVAPTILGMWNLSIPSVMTGDNLVTGFNMKETEKV